MTARRFPPPWTAEEYRGISYIVRDANNFAVAYVYFETEPGRRAAANRMTKDEARKIAAGIAKLPAEFHVMKFGATPARVVAVVRAANEQAALAEAIARRPFSAAPAETAYRPACFVRPPRRSKHRHYPRAVYGTKDRRFPKRDPLIEAMYPGHLIPASQQMLVDLLRRNLELAQSVRRRFVVARAA